MFTLHHCVFDVVDGFLLSLHYLIPSVGHGMLFLPGSCLIFIHMLCSCVVGFAKCMKLVNGLVRRFLLHTHIWDTNWCAHTFRICANFCRKKLNEFAPKVQ